MQKLSLDALAREQLEVARRTTAGRAARTAFGGHEHVMRQTVIALCGGQQLAVPYRFATVRRTAASSIASRWCERGGTISRSP